MSDGTNVTPRRPAIKPDLANAERQSRRRADKRQARLLSLNSGDWWMVVGGFALVALVVLLL
jgi:hypothetical protein